MLRLVFKLMLLLAWMGSHYDVQLSRNIHHSIGLDKEMEHLSQDVKILNLQSFTSRWLVVGMLKVALTLKHMPEFKILRIVELVGTVL